MQSRHQMAPPTTDPTRVQGVGHGNRATHRQTRANVNHQKRSKTSVKKHHRWWICEYFCCPDLVSCCHGWCKRGKVKVVRTVTLCVRGKSSHPAPVPSGQTPKKTLQRDRTAMPRLRHTCPKHAGHCQHINDRPDDIFEGNSGGYEAYVINNSFLWLKWVSYSLVQDCGFSIANAMEKPQFCAKPSSHFHLQDLQFSAWTQLRVAAPQRGPWRCKPGDNV